MKQGTISRKLPVFDKYGRLLGHVAPNATQKAAKLAGSSVQLSNCFGQWGWIPASPRPQ